MKKPWHRYRDFVLLTLQQSPSTYGNSLKSVRSRMGRGKKKVAI